MVNWCFKLFNFTNFIFSVRFHMTKLKVNSFYYYFSSFFVNFDKTYKVKNYDYKVDGKIIEAYIKLNKPLKSNLLNEEIKEFNILNSEIKSKFNQNKKNIKILGDYSFNNENFLKYKFSNIYQYGVSLVKFGYS